MNISDAIELAKENRYIGRPKWGHRCYVFLQYGIFIYSSNGYDSPWVVPHEDLLADDWTEVIPHP